MNRVFVITSTFASVLVLLHISFFSYAGHASLGVHFASTLLGEGDSILAEKAIGDSVAVTQQIANPAATRTTPTRYRAYRVAGDGKVESTFVMPPAQLRKPDGELVAQPTSPGFITAPTDGAYYIWYPRLGRWVYIFDDRGKFLWNKEDSRYLQSFASGKWILAVAGDHSRAHFYKPNLERQIDLEGHIMLKYQLAERDKQEYDACLAFLGGDVAFVNIGKGIINRLNTSTPVKSLACDLDGGKFVAQIERRLVEDTGVRFFDEIVAGSIVELTAEDASAADPDWRYAHALPANHPVTLPLALHPAGYAAVLIPGHDAAPSLRILDEGGEIAADIPLHGFVDASAAAVDDWRAFAADQGLVFWHDNIVLLVQAEGIAHMHRGRGIERVFRSDEIILVQDKRRLLALR